MPSPNKPAAPGPMGAVPKGPRTFWNNPVFMMVLALIMGFATWTIVTVYIDPQGSKTVTKVPINYTSGASAYTSQGLDIVEKPDLEGVTVKVEGNEVLVTRPNDEPEARSLHGLTRSNIANMVNGVVNGYEKKLEIVGVGLRCQKQGSNLVMNLGFSHQVNIPDTEDCTIVWQDPNHFSVTGIDKQKVGQYAAEIRAKKPPEPYKGKGIRYAGEVVKHKEGKAGKGKK
mgnify:CR=1 FL=1